MQIGVLALPESPIVMGVLDYSSGIHLDSALARGEQVLNEGAALIDICAEENSIDDAIDVDKICRIISHLKERIGIPVSISTSNPDMISAAVEAGASMVNDIRSLTMPGALGKAVDVNVPVCLMHMQNDPVTKKVATVHEDVVSEVYQYLEHRINACVDAGIERNKIVIDPGFGFGKSLAHNLCLLRSLNKFKTLHCPIMVGLSRKTMIGQIIDEPRENRAFGSVTAAAIAIGNGADIIRSYEVKGTVDAIKVIKAVLNK